MREKNIERYFCTKVKSLGGTAIKFTSQGLVGVPDRIALFPGGVIQFAELKAPGKTLRPVQEYRAESLKALGFDVYCIDSKAAVDAFILSASVKMRTADAYIGTTV
jgi:hypothetical protein